MISGFKKYILFVAIAAFIFGFSQAVKAFGISPIKILLTVDQNTSQTVVFKISNTGANATETTFKLSVLGTRQDEAGLPILKEELIRRKVGFIRRIT